jgi:alkylhydroperoxidase/carboxymuconolactone decarboxylase family protein YurZ
MMTDSQEVLRRLTIGDGVYCQSVMAAETTDQPHTLDRRSLALLRLGATMMAGSSAAMWQQRVSDALESGLGFDEIVEALTALAPIIGLDRVVAVAPELARALGYDIDAALERLDT